MCFCLPLSALSTTTLSYFHICQVPVFELPCHIYGFLVLFFLLPLSLRYLQVRWLSVEFVF